MHANMDSVLFQVGPGSRAAFAPKKMKQECDAAAHDQGCRKHEPQQGQAGEKYRHAAEGEDRSRDASADYYFRDVNLRVRIVLGHAAPPGLMLSHRAEC